MQVEVQGLLEHLIDMLRHQSADGIHVRTLSSIVLLPFIHWLIYTYICVRPRVCTLSVHPNPLIPPPFYIPPPKKNQLLHEILNKMGGMPGAYDEGLTEAIIRGRGGGETLRMETALFGVREKVSKRSIKHLRDAVVSRTLGALVGRLVGWSDGGWFTSTPVVEIPRKRKSTVPSPPTIDYTTKQTGQPLLLLLATQRHRVVRDALLETAKDIWKAGTIYDKCSSVFIQVSLYIYIYILYIDVWV